MSSFITLLFFLIGMPIAGFFVYTFLDRVFTRLDARTDMKADLDRLNRLQECGSCGRLSRGYQRELARYDMLFKGKSLEKTGQISGIDPCPHCGEEALFRSVSKIFPFHETHLDCLPLKRKEFTEYKRQLEQCEELLYSTKVNETYRSRLLEKKEEC
ncbi:hypothetical protein F9802_16065 [Bacillus aerolatus]|uniref:Uncharacterized protein n=1 Tax=Bacillus aerolatus TaxID=2653354 RepID=A0A6I1FBS2_9BACI|nr:hypothetical protein [Bacillus aerolatus]KAB7704695.1 hypothetical protein F9802_16065 [Bacillus aerolatus]